MHSYKHSLPINKVNSLLNLLLKDNVKYKKNRELLYFSITFVFCSKPVSLLS